MDTNLFKYMAFIKTVEYGSFTKAAEILNYSQSGISRMINDLEKEWNVALLERSRAGVKLTSDGMKLLPYAKRVCEEHAILQNQVDELNGLKTGLIRIGTFSSVATHWIPNMIREFQRDYPNVDYELLLGDYDEIEEWIAEGRVDCGFLRLPVRKEFETTFLERDQLLAILPENHPLCDGEMVSLQSLSEEKFILLERGGKTEVLPSDRPGALVGRRYSVVLRLPENRTGLGGASRGGGRLHPRQKDLRRRRSCLHYATLNS